jgi:hypothetical protein
MKKMGMSEGAADIERAEVADVAKDHKNREKMGRDDENQLLYTPEHRKRY